VLGAKAVSILGAVAAAVGGGSQTGALGDHIVNISMAKGGVAVGNCNSSIRFRTSAVASFAAS